MIDSKQVQRWQRWIVPAVAVFALSAPARAGAGEPEKGKAGDGDRKVEREVKVVRKLGPGGCPPLPLPSGEPGAPHRFLFVANRGFLGVELTPLTPELRRHFGVAEDTGVLVGKVVDGSAAAAAGLEVGDILTHVDGEKVASPGDLGRAVRQKNGGDTVALEYWRDGKTAQTSATLEERERCTFDFAGLPALDHLPDFGELDLELDVDPQVWTEAVQGLQDVLTDADWSEHFAGLKELDLGEIERRMEEVRERLERLERDLARESEKLERLDRDRDEKRARPPARDGSGAQRPPAAPAAL